MLVAFFFSCFYFFSWVQHYIIVVVITIVHRILGIAEYSKWVQNIAGQEDILSFTNKICHVSVITERVQRREQQPAVNEGQVRDSLRGHDMWDLIDCIRECWKNWLMLLETYWLSFLNGHRAQRMSCIGSFAEDVIFWSVSDLGQTMSALLSLVLKA